MAVEILTNPETTVVPASAGDRAPRVRRMLSHGEKVAATITRMSDPDVLVRIEAEQELEVFASREKSGQTKSKAATNYLKQIRGGGIDWRGGIAIIGIVMVGAAAVTLLATRYMLIAAAR